MAFKCIKTPLTLLYAQIERV